MKFDASPSFELGHRPFFSLVVAFYDGRNYLPRLLNSIVNQDMRDDLELIIVDDHSPDPCDDIIEQYSNEICIRRVQTEYNCCPGNSRECGIQAVTGEWLMICDQDDELVEDVLLDIKYTIEKEKPQYYVYTNFREVWDKEGGYHNASNLIRNMNTNTGWNHGKFYNMDNLWRKYNVHFVKDMKSHEDIYISSIMNVLMESLGAEPLHISIYTYIWYKRPGSITNTRYKIDGKDHQFLEIFFDDYVRSTSGAVKQQFFAGNLKGKENFLKGSMVDTVLYQYFYAQSFIFHAEIQDKSQELLERNIGICRKELIEAKLITHLKNKDFYDIAKADDAKRYAAVYDSARLGAGNCIPKYTFLQWLDYLNKDPE